MPKKRPWPDELPDVFLASDALDQGVLTPGQLRDPRLRRLFHGVYAPRCLPVDHALRCRGAALVVPPAARLTGASLATVAGAPLAETWDDVEWVVPHADWRTGRRGTVLRAASRGPLGSTSWRSVPTASRERMGFDLAARCGLELGTARLDVVVRARLLDLDVFKAWLLTRHDDDVVPVRAAADLCDPRAESVPESRCRVRLTLAGFDVAPQFDVFFEGRFVGRVDLALVEWKIAVEYEGKWRTLVEGQLTSDRLRLEGLHRAGWKVVHITAERMKGRGEVEDAVRRAVAERIAGI
ncbi:hypothetical protein FHN55_08500 [Streptomyces sp. NP160]|uniref:hypothetical protein n=1 Tax=Streptomyces sp. NP160 TaxID=2586637 RepID=UPI00111BB483|nr:hypothetical protein [Streptomyces sp. NP160]TNM67854.1 hypothetical protein FHN55_08500 [Streptomyces sp. NP160]